MHQVLAPSIRAGLAYKCTTVRKYMGCAAHGNLELHSNVINAGYDDGGSGEEEEEDEES